MKISTEANEVTRSHDFVESTFRIEGNAVMFGILSSKLYTNVPLAIVRELSTNAADAQVEAGNGDRPFDVRIPSHFDPKFVIRDYGTGLSHDDVIEVYTVFGASTRRDSDDFTGCLGVGSKTPFAYCDQFAIVSYRDGKKSTYTAFKNEKSLPAIVLMLEEETSEPNGLEIQIQVDPADCFRFESAANQVYQHFPVRPNVTGATLVFSDVEPMMQGDGWKLYEQRGSFPARINVRMGKICYAANGSSIQNGLNSSITLVLDVPIGACDIAASREELQYSDKTNTALATLVARAEKEIREQIDQCLDASASELDRVLQRIAFSHIVELPKDSTRLAVTEFEGEGDARKIVFESWGLEVRNQGNRLNIDRSVEFIRPNNDWSKQYTFVENDLPEGAELRATHKRRLRHWIGTESQGRFFLVKIVDRTAWIERFGEPAAKLTELPDVPKAERTGNGGGGGQRGTRDLTFYIKELSTSGWRVSEDWDNLTGEIDTNAVIVPRTAYRAVWMGREYKGEKIREIVKAVGGDLTVYGVTASKYEKVKEEFGLKSLEEVARERVEAYVAEASPETLSMLHDETLESWRWEGKMSSFIDYSVLGNLRRGISPQIDAVMDREEVAIPTRAMQSLVKTFGITVPEPTVRECSDIARDLFVRYPLLKHISSSEVDSSAITGYVQLVERDLNN